MAYINPRAVKHLRKSRKFTQSSLAEKLGVSKRQVAAWESERGNRGTVAIRKDNLKRLSKLLDATESQLAGQEPLPSESLHDSRKQQITVRMTPQSRLNFDLIERCYAVRRDELIEAAPLLFALLAQQSLVWRKEQLTRYRTAIRMLQDGELVPSEIQWGYFDTAGQHLEREENAIESEEVFTPSQPALDDEVYRGNSFADFLIRLAEEVDVVISHNITGDSVFPEHLVCPDTLKEFCGGMNAPQMPRAAYALASGTAQISQIPAELLDDSNGLARSEWLAEKVPARTGEGRYEFNFSPEFVFDCSSNTFSLDVTGTREKGDEE